MNIFKSIRSLFGFNTEVSEAPVDRLDTVLLQKFEVEEKIEKAQDEFNQIDNELSLKIAACDVLIEKGVKEGGDNKKFLADRLDRITNSHLELIKGLIDEKKEIEKQKVDLETRIITKAVEIASQLDEEDQVIVKGQLDVWKETGLIKGEEVSNQAKAITLVLEEFVKGGVGSGHYDHHRRKIAEYKSERNQILRDQENDHEHLAEEGRGGKVADQYGAKLNAIDKKIEHHTSKIKELRDKESAKEAQDRIDAEKREEERVANWDKKFNDSKKNVDLSKGGAGSGRRKYRFKDMAGNIKVFHADNEIEAKKQAEKHFKSNRVFPHTPSTEENEMEKGGEGSRGGKIIGHTKSGKAIYDKNISFSTDKTEKLKHTAIGDTMRHFIEKVKEHGHGMLEHNTGNQHKVTSFNDEEGLHQLKHLLAKHGIESKIEHEKLGYGSGGSSTHLSYNPDQGVGEKKIEKAEEDSEIQKSHEPIAIEIAGKGDIIYDSPVEGHYANVIVRRSFKEGEKNIAKILFLKRASNKKIAPNQFCLPGGHIDEGETIEQAAIRELKEEANLDASYVYTIGKAKCDDGKWAFYLEAPGVQGDTMLLDGESINAAWMSQEEWIEADLIFDLKDHLVAILSKSRKVSDIPDIMKGEKEVEMSWKDFKKEHKRLLDILENGTEEERKAEAKRQRAEIKEYKKVDDEEGFEKAGNPSYINKVYKNGHWIYTYINPNHESAVKASKKIYKQLEPLKAKLKAYHKEKDAILQEQENDPDAIAFATDEIGNADLKHVIDSYGTQLNRVDKKIEAIVGRVAELKAELAPHAEHAESPYTTASEEASWMDKYLHGETMKSEDDEIEKAEGSRGGKIIGHTKSGKPIYAGQEYHSSHYANFSTQDHKDASKAHGEEMAKYKKGTTKYYQHSFHHHTHAQNADSIKNSKNQASIDKVKKHAQKHSPTSTKIFANAHGYHAHDGHGGVNEYDAEGNHTGSKPTSFYSGTTSHQKMHRQVGETEWKVKKAEDSEIEKGGEGTRGGHVIGHTSSGKPIYASSPSKMGEVVSQYSDHSSKDHREIAQHYKGLASKTNWKDPKSIADHSDYNNFAIDHEEIADQKEKESNQKYHGQYVADRHLKKAEDEDILEKAMFHPERPNHRYIRREGSEGNYTYYYDSPEQKSKDGKTFREGLYSSNTQPKYDKETMEKIARNIDAMDIHYGYIDGNRNAYNSWRDLDGKIRDVLKITPEDQKKELAGMVKPEKAKFFRLISGESEIGKAFDIDNPFYYNNEEELIKGRAAAEGEERVWGGKTYKKVGKQWVTEGKARVDNSSDASLQSGHKAFGDALKTKSAREKIQLVDKAKGYYEEHAKSLSDKDLIENHKKASAGSLHQAILAKHLGQRAQEKLDKEWGDKRGAAEKGNAGTVEDSVKRLKEGGEKKHSTKHIKEHVENTSTDQLKKVAEKEDHPHNDAAKRELERRASSDKDQAEKRLAPFEKRLNNLLKTHVSGYSVDKIESIEMTPKGNYFINMTDRGTVSLTASAIPSEVIDQLAQKYGFKLHDDN